ncbi:hypothetical protein JB92DRAFT_3060272, partial [Gautieria morchelliformis]
VCEGKATKPCPSVRCRRWTGPLIGLSQGGISGMEEAGLVEVLAPGAVQPVPAGGRRRTTSLQAV